MVLKTCCALLASLVSAVVCGASSAATIDYYRFENGLTDSGTAAQNATAVSGSPAATFSSNVPNPTIPATGAANTASISLTSSTALQFNYAFPLNTLTNATLEFYVDPSAIAGEQDLFWTTTGSGDQNRFNIGIPADGSLFVDYREPNGTLHSLDQTGANAIRANQWNFVALVKSGNTYSLYVNNLSPITNTDVNPNLPTSTAWTINGRQYEQPAGGLQFAGLVDEVRISDQALAPSAFLNAPEPASAALLASAGILLLRRRRAT
jgi:hypothetical protein